jgi:hypothetical protein
LHSQRDPIKIGEIAKCDYKASVGSKSDVGMPALSPACPCPLFPSKLDVVAVLVAAVPVVSITAMLHWLLFRFSDSLRFDFVMLMAGGPDACTGPH